MASNKKIIEKAAALSGLTVYKDGNTAYGTVSGFPVIIMGSGANERKQYIRIDICACRDGQPLTGEDCQGHRILTTVDAKGRNDDIADKVYNSINEAVGRISTSGCTPCDDTGAEGEVSLYSVKGKLVFLTAASADQAESELAQLKSEYDEIQERPVPGLFGALIGSLAGMAIILLLGRLGRVSMISGIVMGFAIIFFYKKLGKKLSLPGGIGCVVISIIMTYLSFRIDTAIDVYNIFKDEVEVTFSECFLLSKTIFELGDSLDTYYLNMALMMLTGVVGTAVLVFSDINGTKEGFKIEKIS